VSNLSTLVNAIGDNNTTALDIAGDVFAILPELSGGIGFVQTFVNFIQPKDQLLQQMLLKIQQTIDSDFRQLQGDIAAEGILAKERDIDNGVNNGAAIFALLPTIVPELASLSEDYILTQVQTCVAMVQFFTDYEDKWVIPWAPLPQYSDTWSGTMAPPQQQFVFNYTYVLPQFLRAIYMFQSVVIGLKPSILVQQDIQTIFSKCAAKLQTVHDTMVEGLWGTKPPGASDVAAIGATGDHIQGWVSYWCGDSKPGRYPGCGWGFADLWPFGAVEVYSSANNVSSYAAFMPYEFQPQVPAVPESFLRLVHLRIEDRKKMLYKQLGLPTVRQAIDQLRVIAGQPVSTALAYETWSLRDAASILGISSTTPGEPGFGFFESLKTLLVSTPPYSGGWLYSLENPVTYPQSPLPNSFRSLFAAVAGV
jgi:hypothetical protein